MMVNQTLKETVNGTGIGLSVKKTSILVSCTRLSYVLVKPAIDQPFSVGKRAQIASFTRTSEKIVTRIKKHCVLYAVLKLVQ